MKRAIILAVLLTTSVFAETLAPETSPVPIGNPNRPSLSDVESADAQPIMDKLPLDAPIYPDDPAPGMRDHLVESDADFAACLTKLNELGVVFVEAEPIIQADDSDCGILRPLVISQIAPGVEVKPVATIRCETAAALSTWTTEFVIPASARLVNLGKLNAIENGSGYICKRRGNRPDGKLSEHAFGNAFDVMAFGFDDGSRLAIEPREAEGSMAEAFQDAVRATACLEFSTVLGPGSNAAHDDHLHLDIIERSGGYRLCEQGGTDPGK